MAAVTAEEAQFTTAQDQARGSSRLADMAYYGLLGLAATVAPVDGALEAATVPAAVSYAPGVPGSAQLEFGGDPYLSLGAAGGILFPDTSTNVPFLGKVSGQVNINSVTLPDHASSDNLSLYTALVSKPDSIINPAETTIFIRLAEGFGAGLLFDAALIGSMALSDKSRKRLADLTGGAHSLIDEQDTTIKELHPDRSLPTNHLETKDRLKKASEANSSRRHRVGRAAVALGLVIAGGFGFNHVTSPSNSHPTRAECMPFPAAVTDVFPQLQRAEACGSGAQAAVNTIVNYKQVEDKKFLGEIIPNLDKLLASIPDEDLFYLNDPRYTAAAVVSDYHCDQPSETQVLPRIVHKFQVPLILNAGDVGISHNKFLLDKYCADGFKPALTPTKDAPTHVTMLVEPGNHDSSTVLGMLAKLTVKGVDGKSYHPVQIINKDSDYRAKVDGLTVVAIPDPRSSVFGEPLQPTSDAEQDKLLTDQGNQLKNIACGILKKTGNAPIAMPHGPEVARAATVADCLTTAISGHLHVESAPQTYIDDTGHRTTVFSQGTSSGVAECGITIYNAPVNDAPISIFVFERDTNIAVGMFNFVNHPDGSWSYSGYKPFDTIVPVPNSVTKYVADSSKPNLHNVQPGVSHCH